MVNNVTSPFRVPVSLRTTTSPNPVVQGDISELLSKCPSLADGSMFGSSSSMSVATSGSIVPPSTSSGSMSGLSSSLGTTRQKRRRSSSSGCMCRQSKCIKMYCDCFSNHRHCTSDCSCTDCENVQSNESFLIAHRTQAKARNPNAFSVETGNESGLRCSCTKSRCLNKYCECIRAGRLCTSACQCNACENAQGCAIDMPFDAPPFGVLNEHIVGDQDVSLFEALSWTQ